MHDAHRYAQHAAKIGRVHMCCVVHASQPLWSHPCLASHLGHKLPQKHDTHVTNYAAHELGHAYRARHHDQCQSLMCVNCNIIHKRPVGCGTAHIVQLQQRQPLVTGSQLTWKHIRTCNCAAQSYLRGAHASNRLNHRGDMCDMQDRKCPVRQSTHRTCPAAAGAPGGG